MLLKSWCVYLYSGDSSGPTVGSTDDGETRNYIKGLTGWLDTGSAQWAISD